MIEVNNLNKKYGSVQALNGISFNIKQGEFFGLLGPNGAGKTTTISILSTILEPDGGEVKIAGHDLKKDKLSCKKVMGVVPQELALYNELNAFDNLMFWGSLYNVSKADLKKRIYETMQLFGLAERMNDKIKTYSGGMKRRINIASALLHTPKILFMDEPTVGIDPQSRNLIFEVVEKLHKEGMTIVYTTHYMEEAERLCDRIAIIDKGNIITQGSLRELQDASEKKESIVISFQNVSPSQFTQLASAFKGCEQEGSRIYFYSHGTGQLANIILKCGELGLEINHIDIQRVNLETIFLTLTGKQLRD